MLFMPYAAVPNCTLLLAVVWANGKFWTDCDHHLPSPWTPTASAALHSIIVARTSPQAVDVVPFSVTLSVNETRASVDLFKAFLNNQIIVVPASCNVHPAIVHDWHASPYTFARAVLMHRPPRIQVSVDKVLHLLGGIGPIVAVMYIATAFSPLNGAH